jgi:hypothetical protein
MLIPVLGDVCRVLPGCDDVAPSPGTPAQAGAAPPVRQLGLLKLQQSNPLNLPLCAKT